MTDSRNPSRRDFLAASAIGLIGLAHGSAQTDGDLLYVGTYTEGGRSDGIYLVRMNRRSGELLRVGSVNAGANPSFLAIHPNGGGSVLYAVNELENGAVSAFAVERATGGAPPLNTGPSGGGAPRVISANLCGRGPGWVHHTGGAAATRATRATLALAT